jgi:general secretion pathway protein A
MYTKYYGLTKKPFDLTPNPDAVFMSDTHQEALAILKYGVLSRKSFLVLTAEVGIGKTTLLQALVDSLDMEVHVCMLNNPILHRDEFFAYLAEQYQVPWEGNKGLFLLEFEKFLQRCHKRQERVLLIVDEAHVLPIDLLEEVRLLSNMDVKGQDVLSIFLVGQPELNEQMRHERLLPLRQRIGIRFHLNLFSPEETRQYILFRLRTAGARHLNVFNDEAIAVIHRVSRGTPRLINIVCDHALLSGFAENKPVIGPDLIEECVRELHFPGEDNPLPVTSGRIHRVQTKHVVLVSAVLAAVVLVMLLLELVPQTNGLSPLDKIVPDSWVQLLHWWGQE